MGAKRVPDSCLHSQPPATPPYSYRHSDPGDAWYMPISMHFDSCNPKHVPTLQFKAIWVLKGCPAPACILSPLPGPLTPIGIVTLGMLDICPFRCISTLSTLNVCQHYNLKQYGCVSGHLCGEFTGHRWIPRTKASDANLWSFLWCAPE